MIAHRVTKLSLVLSHSQLEELRVAWALDMRISLHKVHKNLIQLRFIHSVNYLTTELLELLGIKVENNNILHLQTNGFQPISPGRKYNGKSILTLSRIALLHEISVMEQVHTSRNTVFPYAYLHSKLR